MKIATRLLIALLAATAVAAPLAIAMNNTSSSVTWHRPELEYLKAVNRAGPPKDPQLLFLLMSQYANANLRAEGIEFFSNVVKEFGPRLSDRDKSLYLAAIGLLRAGHANEVSIFKRIGWVRETIAILEEAKRLSGEQAFIVRWVSGVVNAQFPGFFSRKDAAQADLNWCVEHADKAPHAGWLREVYYQLAAVYREDGRDAEAREYLRRSGYPDFGKSITLTTPFAENVATGHTFSAKRIAEIVPGRVYALSGFEFTEYYFVVSDDRRELISIDAGTRPDSAKMAYEALRAHVPGLPKLTTILVTHAHWDHVGGHRYFRALNPRPKFYARANYREELVRTGPNPLFTRFFGSQFSLDTVRDFRPDITIDRQTDLRIGGTHIVLIPVRGGETNDAMFVHLPDLGTLFVGDFIMPYLGAPFVEEGNLDGLLGAIDVVASKKPKHLLHGHEPLTRLFRSPSMLMLLKAHLAWLRDQVVAAIQSGSERSVIQQANLIPPGLLDDDPDTHIPYLVMRENVINRVYDQHTGYWQPDLQGVDYLGRADHGALLVDYLHVSESQLIEAAERMIADGKYELAVTALNWTHDRFPRSTSLGETERRVYRKLMEKYQEFNPFKFILYSGKSGDQVPQMEPVHRNAASVAIMQEGW